ncbi:MAG: glycosyltransferase [Anaerolineae bacterium]|nr:glycosyltransferase [Anaerolineae bacterium]
MRILVLAPQLPYPPHQGTSLRNFNLVAGLSRRHHVHLLCFTTPESRLDQIQPLREVCESIDTVPQPARTTSQRLWTTLTSTLPDMAHRLASPAFDEKLRQSLTRHTFDIIEFEGIEMIPYLRTVLECPKKGSPHIIFDDHNAEYVLQKRVFESDIVRPPRWPGAVYSFIQWHKLVRYEAWACRQVDAVAAVSAQDAAALQRIVPDLDVAVVPNGVDISLYESFVPDESFLPPHSLVFTGKMDFRPNVDAVLWFAQRVFPLVRERVPDAQFFIAGQRPHRRLDSIKTMPGITITGFVPEILPYIAGAAVYVIPLQSGGGTRLKVLEAMAMRQAIVSTSMGCDGYPLTSGREAILADDPAQFANNVVVLLHHPERRRALGEAAFQFAQQYDWANIVPQLEAIYPPNANPKT